MEDREILANNLVKYRKKVGISQLELADKLNYSNKNISKWEKGETTPNVFILQKIASLYQITVDDLLADNTDEIITKDKSRIKIDLIKRNIFRIAMLILANFILFAVGSVAIYVLGIVGVSSFNKWLIYFYLIPLTFLSINIYIRVLYKIVEPITLSFMGWIICGCIYVSLKHIRNIELIFVIGAAYQLLVICISVLINVQLFNKIVERFKKLRREKRIK